MKSCRAISLIIAAILVLSGSPLANGNAPDKFKAEFESRYEAWEMGREKWINEHPVASCGSIDFPPKEIVSLGPGVAPLLVDKVVEEICVNGTRADNRKLAVLCATISDASGKFMLAADGWRRDMGTQDEAKLWIRWWKTGRKQTAKRFDAVYQKYKNCLSKGILPSSPDQLRQNEADELLLQIESMGIDVLPLLVSKLDAGDEDVIRPITDINWSGRFGATALEATGQGLSALTTKEKPMAKPTRASVLKWWNENKDKVRLPDP